ncbi:MAG: extracellular solute-binding protein, partial [Erysipelotrichales bacterium]|nr:extracellular solute-binding protein [Erysipelotrichales bacterium]
MKRIINLFLAVLLVFSFSGLTRVSASEPHTGQVSHVVSENAEIAKGTIDSVAAVTAGLKITWKSISKAQGYQLYRRASGETKFTRVRETASLSYTDKNVEDGKTYTYKVRGYVKDSAGKYTYGAFSDVLSYIKVGVPEISSAANAADGIKITWNKAVKASSYQIYRKASNESKYVKVKSVGSKTLEFTDQDVVNGRVYSYKVRAYYRSSSDKIYYGYFSPVSAVKKMGKASVSLAKTSTGIKVSWKQLAGASGYQVYRKGPGETSYKKVKQTTALSFTDTNVQTGMKYDYKVRGYFKDEDGKYQYALFSAVKSLRFGKASATIWYTFTNYQQDYLENAINQFNQSQDEYVINGSSQPFANFKDNVKEAVANGEGPDMIIDYASFAAEILSGSSANSIPDLEKYLSKSLINALEPGAKEEAKSFADGKMHAFPLYMTGSVLFYNTEMLEAAGVDVPTTWDELYAAAEEIHKLWVWSDEDGYHYSKDNPGNGIHPYGFGIDSKAEVLQSIIAQNGLGLFDSKTRKCLFDDPKIYAALDQFRLGCENGSVEVNATVTGFFSEEFNTGNVGMFIGSAAGYPYLNLPWGAAAVPQTEGGVDKVPVWFRDAILFQ